MGEAVSTRERWREAFMRELGNSFDLDRYRSDVTYNHHIKAIRSWYLSGRECQVERDAAIARGALGLDDMSVEAIARIILAQLEPSRG